MSADSRHLDQYELQERLTSDAISQVWKAYDTQQHRYVAIKILHFNPQISPANISHFLRDVTRLKSLHHPNIASILAVQMAQEPTSMANEAYIVMEFIEGQALADYIRATSQTGNFPPVNEILRLLIPISSAIDYAHQQGIIHGALRPTNILLDKRHISNHPMGEPRLVGFGTNTLQTPLALSLNEVQYISPERAQGYTENARSDIYSLGVILYEMCTGTLPFQGDTSNDILMQHIHANPTSPALINPHILPALTAVIMRSLAKDPIARFPTTAAMVVAVARALNIPTQDILSQSGSWMGSTVNVSLLSQLHDAQDSMNSPTYLSPLPQSSHLAALPSPVTPGESQPSQTPSLASSSYAPPSHPSLTPRLPSSTDGMPVLSPATPQQQWSQPYPALTNTPTITGFPTQTPQVPLPQAPARSPLPPTTGRGKRTWLFVLIPLLLLAILASGLGIWLFNLRPQPTAPVEVMGRAIFISSGQVNEKTTQGIADRMQINLQNLPNPQPGKNYYTWLLNDNDSQVGIAPILLGSSSHGSPINMYFPGDVQHDNLLLNYSRLLVTEEDANNPPANPSLDAKDRKYMAAFSQVKRGTYSLLDHLRHLLSQDPKLKGVGITGGLDIWLFRNTLKVLEEAGSIRDARSTGNTDFMYRQLVRMLDYLDGSQYVQTEKLPPKLPAVMIDPAQARVAMLEIDPQNQNPPGYLKHIGNHLGEIVRVSGITPEQKTLAIQINSALNNVQAWLLAVHKDAAQLAQMTPQQLLAPSTLPLLNDLFIQANNAFVGQTDPNTNLVRDGVVQIHYSIQGLATFEIQQYSAA